MSLNRELGELGGHYRHSDRFCEVAASPGKIVPFSAIIGQRRPLRCGDPKEIAKPLLRLHFRTRIASHKRPDRSWSARFSGRVGRPKTRLVKTNCNAGRVFRVLSVAGWQPTCSSNPRGSVGRRPAPPISSDRELESTSCLGVNTL